MNSTKLKQQAKRVTTMVGSQMILAAATMQTFAYSTDGTTVSAVMLGLGQSSYNLKCKNLQAPLPMILGIMGYCWRSDCFILW